MEIIIIWAIFIIIVIMNMNKAKKMQQERMQEHQRNMQEHNQNVQQTQNVYPVNGPLKQGSLSHGANLNREQQTYSGSQKMTSAEAERLKQQIRERNNFQGKTAGSDAVSSHRAEAPVPQYTAPPPAADNAAPVMKTLDKAEFHSPVMQAGSTGTYSNMTGGHTFTQYDCGHEYNNEIVPQSQKASKGIIDDMKFDKNEMRKAFVMQEILKRKVI